MNAISKYYISKHLYRLHCAFCEMANCYVTGVAKALHSCKIYGGFKIIVRARLSYGFRSWRAATFVPGYQTDVRFVGFQIKTAFDFEGDSSCFDDRRKELAISRESRSSTGYFPREGRFTPRFESRFWNAR